MPSARSGGQSVTTLAIPQPVSVPPFVGALAGAFAAFMAVYVSSQFSVEIEADAGSGDPGACTLWVNGSTGNDATSKASNTEMAPWDTIGRAAWGSTDRSMPDSMEAADAGDVVCIEGGQTYSTTTVVDDRFGPVYNPVNEGAVGNYLSFKCVNGVCTLGAEDADAPVAGTYDKDYVKWFADRAAGNTFLAKAYFPTDGLADADEVNVVADTGPVIAVGGTGAWLEGFDINGQGDIHPADYDDNINGIRVESCTSCFVVNNKIQNVHSTSDDGNVSAITIYGSPGTTASSNWLFDTFTGIYFKDTGSTLDAINYSISLNLIETTSECFRFSLVSFPMGEVVGDLSQNICNDTIYFVNPRTEVIGARFINNTGYAVETCTGVMFGSGNVWWNNVCRGSGAVKAALYSEDWGIAGFAGTSFEHNDYHNFTTFYSATDGTKSFATWQSDSSEDSAAPASITSDPLFANAGGGDFRLCTGSGVPHASCSGASPAIAIAVDILDLDGDSSTSDNVPSGAYVLGTEVIGIIE